MLWWLSGYFAVGALIGEGVIVAWDKTPGMRRAPLAAYYLGGVMLWPWAVWRAVLGGK